jgi:hypothetical protein
MNEDGVPMVLRGLIKRWLAYLLWHDVPTALRGLIPLAVRWGIGDDYERTESVKTASTAELRALVQAIDRSDPLVWDEWLIGPAASSPDPSAEYLAFTCLLMAVDQARLELARR